MNSKLQDTTAYNAKLLESIFRTSKKTVQEYVREIERHCRFKTFYHQVGDGTLLDDRAQLIDLYEACVQQDSHIASVLETLESQIIGERYMLARENEKGRWVKDVEATKKIQGTQFVKLIKGIAEAKLYGYTGIEICDEIDPRTGRLKEINIIERRNILPDQKRIVRRQGQWFPGWDFESTQYQNNYILINTGSLGLFSATTPLILAKKFTFANYVNFSHTYGQPIIHGKTESESLGDRQRLADDIANAAQNKILVTGQEDSIDIKTFTMSNSEKIFTSLIEMINAEVSNLILGSESMAGATQSYVGSTQAHQDIYRDRVAVYREWIENVMNEEVIPRLIVMGYIPAGVQFKYSKRLEMNNKDQISLYDMLTNKYEVAPDEIEKTFGVVVGKQLSDTMGGGVGGPGGDDDGNGLGPGRHLTDEQYYRRYGHKRGESATNFLDEGE